MLYSARLRSKYPDLIFFDSIHASTAILDGLTYYDLGEIINEIINVDLYRSTTIG